MKKKIFTTILVVLIVATAAVALACRTPDDEPDVPFEEDKIRTYLTNGGFENGLNDWLVLEGNAFSPFAIVRSTDLFWMTRPFMARGNWFYNGFELGEAPTGRMRSQMFTLAGDGYISFMVGGGAQRDKTFISIHKEDGEEVYRFVNTAFSDPEMTLNLHRTYIHLPQFIGQVLYIQLNDLADTGPFGFLTADDFIVSMTEAEAITLAYETFEEAMALSEASSTWFNGINVNAFIKNFYRSYNYPFPVSFGSPPEPPETETTLRNGGFENGLDYWYAVEGDLFTPAAIRPSTSRFWVTRNFMARGDYFFDGFHVGENRVGKMRTQKFTLAGEGFISFLIGGGPQMIVTIHTADGTEIHRYTNTAAFNDPHMVLNMHREYIHLPERIGQVLYIQLEDPTATGPFGAMTADDFLVSLTLAQVREVKRVKLEELNAMPPSELNYQTNDVKTWMLNFYANYDYPFTDE